METPSDCVYYPFYYYLHNSIQNHPNSWLVWPKPQNRKSGQRRAHYLVEASLLSSHHYTRALFFFLPSLPTTQRGLCRGESFIVVARRVACEQQTYFQSLLLWSHCSGREQSMKSIIDDNRCQSISINWLILIINGQSIMKIFVIIDYHRFQCQSIIDGNRSINIIDCYQYAISIDYLLSQTSY